MPIPHDYVERVYAGVLGKLIGVYLGRPFEGWTYDHITAELGEITSYVHERLGKPLVVTDDDISGTFAFLRALPDHGTSRELTPAQIGETWLNNIIERKTILWWGGMGNSTEHTAYLRLKAGVPAPESGSIALNGRVVAEQIGAQIFIDGWAMVAPGDPELAAELARRAGSVSHDGAAIHGAQVLAAMEAQAFVESRIDRLLEVGVSCIPSDSLIQRMISDIREWHAAEPDWRKTRERIAERYGYDRYGGGCHMVPNHALIVHALLHGEGDFGRSLSIVNTCGWDTDCNSGNLGCLLGIRGGLAAIDSRPDLREPVADRMYVAAAEGGEVVTDALRTACWIANLGHKLQGEAPVSPKGRVRFHFEAPGAVQGFQLEDPSVLRLENVEGHSESGHRSLALRYRDLGAGKSARVATATFIPPDAVDMPGYGLLASPTLYPGQTVRARVSADASNGAPVTCRLYLQVYGPDDKLEVIRGSEVQLDPGSSDTLEWQVGDTGGAPVARVGLELEAADARTGTLYLDYLGWRGEPDAVFRRPERPGTMWRRAWVDGTDHPDQSAISSFRMIQNEGTGLLTTGTREWRDYAVSATLTVHLASSAGVAGRVQGMRRYYALLLGRDGRARLVKALDGVLTLAETGHELQLDRPYELRLEVSGSRLAGWIDGKRVLQAEDDDLKCGGVALVCEEGHV
ncbi:MAG: ADP-ribosylglycohydrolase family protein, partial [Chloroflexota bacterium]|nr:ADP-ribosylglycohydrolase family protein [Chloroflexota bacterium]